MTDADLLQIKRHASDCINETNELLDMIKSTNSNIGVLQEKQTETEKKTTDIINTTKLPNQLTNGLSDLNQMRIDNLDSMNGPVITNLLNNDVGKFIPDSTSTKINNEFTEGISNIEDKTIDQLSLSTVNAATETTFSMPYFQQITKKTPFTKQVLWNTETVIPTFTLAPSTIPIIEYPSLTPNTLMRKDEKDKLKKLEADLRLVDEVQSILNGIKVGDRSINKRNAGYTIQTTTCLENTPLFELNMKIVTQNSDQYKKISGLGKILKQKQDANKCRKKRLAENARKIDILGKIYQWKHQKHDNWRRKRTKLIQSKNKRFLGHRQQNLQ